MRAKKSYAKGGKVKKKDGLKGANKVTGAKATRYTAKDMEMYEKGKSLSERGMRFPHDMYRIARGSKDLKKHIGTPGQPSPYFAGARAAKTEAKDTATAPMRKKELRSVQTAGAKKALKGRTSGKGGNVSAGMKAPTKKRRR